MTIQIYVSASKGVSSKTAIRDMKRLVDSGLVKKVGYKKGAYFCANENVPKK